MKLFIQLGWFFRQQWHRYTSAIALLIIVAALQLLPPKIVGLFVDDMLSQPTEFDGITKWLSLLIGIAILIYILRYFWRFTLFGASYQLAVQLRNQFYQKLSKQTPAFYLRHRTGDLIARATNDVDRVVFAAGEGILTCVDSLIMGCAVLVVMSTQISWQLTLVSLLPMPIMAVLIKRYGSELHKRFKIAQDAFSTLNDQTQDSLSSIRMIKSFGLERYQAQRFKHVAEDVGQKNMCVAYVDAKFDPTIYLFVASANLLAVGYGGWMVLNQQLTLGELTSFIMYLGLMIWPMLALAWMFNIVERGSAAYSRIAALINEPEDLPQGQKQPSSTAQVLHVDIDEFCYPEAHRSSLQNVHLELKPAGMLGICGITGSGKSTLLALIQRHFDVEHGSITYGEDDITSFSLNSWRQKLAVVNQSTFLFSASILENLKLANPQATIGQIEHAARIASIHDDILRFPQGYQTEVGEKGVMLSGGQKQRLAIARAILADAEIVILDDALSAVDGHTEHQILLNLMAWKQDRTLIVSAHRLSALAGSDEIVVFNKGDIIQRGKHSELVEQAGWYQNMYRYQQLEAALDDDQNEGIAHE